MSRALTRYLFPVGVPFDFFRYTDAGARAVFSSAGFAIDAMQKVGDSYLASGYALSFGTGDFDNGWLSRKLLGNFTNTTALDPAEWLYTSVVLVARKPA